MDSGYDKKTCPECLRQQTEIRRKYFPQSASNKKCSHCGLDFSASHSRQVYCGNECRMACGNKNRKKYYYGFKHKKYQ
jgi:hypothetical protein